MKALRSLVSLLSINLLFVWCGIQLTVADGLDGKERMKTLFLLMALAANVLAIRKFSWRMSGKNLTLSIGLAWLLYAIGNTVFQYHATPKTSAFLFITVDLILPFILMAVVSSTRADRVQLLVKSLQYSLCVFLLLVAVSAGFDGARLSVERFDPNELSLYLFLLISTASINYFLGTQGFLVSVSIVASALTFSVLLGSRMGFAGCLLLAAGFFYVTRNSLVSINRLIVTAPIVALVLTVVLNETTVGERLLGTAAQSQSWEYDPAKGTIFQYYGDRGVYYILGWEAFQDSPIFGIGLRNFQFNYYSTVMHPEIMIQLAELGLIGMSLYLLFLGRVHFALRRQFKFRHENAAVLKYLVYAFIVLVYSSTVLFLYKSLAVAALYGIIVLFSRDDVMAYLDHSLVSRRVRASSNPLARQS